MQLKEILLVNEVINKLLHRVVEDRDELFSTYMDGKHCHKLALESMFGHLRDFLRDITENPKKTIQEVFLGSSCFSS